ncbi:MAG: DUF4397 domain-containing protein [Proteobacteria bacterium]|nr:DUF4397 domain-containing protein [Pseudomonadota bacterium]
MKNFRWWGALALMIASAVALSGCGGGGGGSANVRVVNATLTHASIDLLLTSDSSKVISDVTTNTVSSYASVSSGSPSFQLVDSGSTTSIYGTTPSLPGGSHVAIVAYQIDGVIQTQLLSEDATNPTAGFFNFRVFDTAIDAGALYVYLVDAGAAAPTSSTAPSYVLTPSGQIAATPYSTITTKNYDIYVTSQSDPTDLRLKIANYAPTDAQNTTLVLTPTSGGVLVNGGLLVQQGSYTAAPSSTARVRLVGAVPGTTIAASVGGTSIGSVAAPRVSVYQTVPVSSSSTVAVTVNGTTITPPAGTIAVGTDNTLLVYGTAGAPKATLLADDNHGSLTVGNVKIRLVNAMSGTSATSLTWSYGGAALPTPIAVGAASAYYESSLITQASVVVQSATDATTIYSNSLVSVLGNQVYTLFIFGNGGSPSGITLDSAD